MTTSHFCFFQIGFCVFNFFWPKNIFAKILSKNILAYYRKAFRRLFRPRDSLIIFFCPKIFVNQQRPGGTQFWFFRNISIFGQDFDFRPKFWFFTKISIFGRDFDFRPIFFCPKIFVNQQRPVGQNLFNTWKISGQIGRWGLSVECKGVHFWQYNREELFLTL